MSKNKTKKDSLEYLVGKKKAQLIRYALKKQKFYQAEAAKDLHWSISKVQYHLYRFVKYNLFLEIPTKTKTYYQANMYIIKKFT